MAEADSGNEGDPDKEETAITKKRVARENIFPL